MVLLDSIEIHDHFIKFDLPLGLEVLELVCLSLILICPPEVGPTPWL